MFDVEQTVISESCYEHEPKLQQVTCHLQNNSYRYKHHLPTKQMQPVSWYSQLVDLVSSDIILKDYSMEYCQLLLWEIPELYSYIMFV